MSGIKEKVVREAQKTIEKYQMFQGAKKLVIAFSSGPDSVCLLDVLHTLYGERVEFHLVYVNHGLRPQKYLQREEDLTKRYALKYNISHTVRRIQVRKRKIGIEAAAREMRYDALLKYMDEINAKRIVLGHNCDDVVETFFMNLLRGSGVRGLMSIPPVRLPFIRPLINVKKTEILKYLKAEKLSYSCDETNRILSYRRNLLRRKVIPELLKINPEIHEIVKREIGILRQEHEYLENQTERIYKSVVRRELNYILLDIKKILRYNKAVVNRVVMRVIQELCGSLDGFESKHYEAIVGLKDKTSGKRVSLPKGLYAQKEYGDIIVGFSKPTSSAVIPLGTEKELLIFGNVMVRARTVKKFDLRHVTSSRQVFDLDEIEPPLFMRNRKRGDYIITRIGKKKIKKLYQESRVPLHKRNEPMLLCDQKGILWIFGLARAFRGFIGKHSKKILVVEFERTC